MYLYQKLKYNYKHLDIKDKNIVPELGEFIKKAIKEGCKFMVYDTETTGLSIITDTPFLVAIGFNKTVITFDYDEQIMRFFFTMYNLPDNGTKLQEMKNYIGLFAHNAKYDYHMLENGGSKIPDNIKILDSITVARLTEFADERESMSLENLGSKYVDESSKFAGKIIKDLVKKINAEKRKTLREKLMEEFPDDGFFNLTKGGKKRGTSLLTKLLDDYDRDRTQFVNDDNVYYKFIDENYTPATYKDVYEAEPELMRSYAADDIVICIEYLNKSLEALKTIDIDYKVLNREGELIKVVADLEKVGLKVDIDYILKCRKDVVNYRDLLYMELEMYTGVEFSVGQHEFIKKLLKDKYAIKTDKADEKALKYIKKNSDDEEVRDICANILELRTIDKWLSTYIDGKLNSVINGRIHTNINNNGAVSGRVSCDMQQQPKEGLKDRDGNELFHPRRMFVVDDGYIFAFCDESQMELRVQAYYTIVVGEPDLNLCRAYIPYKCYTIEEPCNDRRFFNYENIQELYTFDKYKWYKEESGEEWHPTDLHSETTSHAFPNLEVGSAEFKKKRKLGKVCNFLKVYQGGVQALQESLDLDRDTAEKLDQAFYSAFPNIKEYQDWVNKQLYTYGYVENLYGRRYYMNDSRWFYKGCNYLIQGTCADMMKVFEIEVWKYLKGENLKSKMVLPIHDEIMLLVHKDEMFVINKVKEIMEDVSDIIKNIPMISDREISTTNWAEKIDYVEEKDE